MGMKKSKVRNVPDFKNVKDIVYNSVKQYPNHVAREFDS